MRQLVLGCGHNKTKSLIPNQVWDDVVTIDIDKTCNPTYCCNLNCLPYPFKDNEFDEIHAYEVLEHLGRQGNYLSFFELFNELWRIMKPDAKMFISTPNYKGMWAWSDPGHRRVISDGTLVFLDQEEYKRQIGKTSMTDYRECYHGDFKSEMIQYNEDSMIAILRCKK